MKRIALGVEYDGTKYFGWQKQRNLPTVQNTLEQALAKIANHEVAVICAGRTDVGVHATGQVVHFDTEVVRPEVAWVLGVNTHLPDDVRVHWMKEVSLDFSARFSALARTYQYSIYSGRVYPALLRYRAAWLVKELDLELMRLGAEYLIGEHDFSSFRGKSCQARTATRCVKEISLERKNDLVVITIKANAFLQHMVRNIIGVLVEIGLGKQPPFWAQELLQAKDRMLAGVTMPPQGLCLVGVEYAYAIGVD